MMYRWFRLVLVGILVLWWSIVADGEGNVVRNEDICGLQNGRRLYLELGEKGILYARNVSFVKNEPRQTEDSRVYTGNSSHAQCSLELVTCPSCVIIVTFETIALSHHCGDGSVTMDSPCRCDYVWISEPPYEDVSGTPFCGLYAPITYRSSTRTLSITLFYSQSHKHAFTLEYTAERNRLHLRGTKLTATGQAAKGLNSTGGGILTSPFFPARYPRDLGLEYVVTCPSESPSCRIRLLFSDFQLATVSIMEFYDWNGQRLDVSSGARFRPPVIMSSGPSLLIRFYANGGTGLGYKAFYSFVIGHPLDKSVQPITDCGGYVENLGGAITMMDMVDEGVKTYDCVWLIRPPKNFLHMKTHMYLKVVTFADMAGNTELIVKQGPTSALLPLEILRHPASQVQPPRHREHVAPVTSGFHVSLRGTFGSSSHLAIAYAAFSYMDCFAGSDFLCRNHRCIPNQLNCDGFDHCGDNSDEPATCFQDWEMEPQDRKWHVNKANYYFPKIDRYPDLKTATLVFVASSLGLIVLISALIILLYRMGARARQQRELQSRLQTISELLDGARIDEISVSDDPPVYEAPPGYDEVVKFGLDSEIVGRKKRRGLGRESRSRSSPCQSCSLDVGRASVCSITETANSSRRSSRATPTPGQESSCASSTLAKVRTVRVPESPPPPYVTPPGSMSRNFTVPGFIVASCSGREREENGRVDDEGDGDDDDHNNNNNNNNSNNNDNGDDENRNGENEGEREGKDAAEGDERTERSTEEGPSDGSWRRDWFRRSGGQFSLPLTGNGERVGSSTDTLQRTSFSADAELFGVYTRNRENASSSIETADDACCDSQRKISRVVSTDTVPDYGGGEDGVEGRYEKRAKGTEEHEDEGLAVGQRGIETSPEIKERDGGNVKSEDVSVCCCEGACGCATVRPTSLPKKRTAVPGYLWPPRCVSSEQDGRAEDKREGDRRQNGKAKAAEAKAEPERAAVAEGEGEGEGNSRLSRNTIVRLLNGTKGGKWQNGGNNTGGGGSAFPSTASSTPCDTLRRSTRKLSVCSREACLGRTFTSIRSIGGSYEKLSNGEFEVTRNSLHASDPATIGACGQRRGYRRYSSCDLESLCEGIKMLDGFLAHRGLAVAHTRKQSVTVMLFGTPAHGAIRRGSEEERIREVVRVSRFSLDALSSN